jgi:hypothetical protein
LVVAPAPAIAGVPANLAGLRVRHRLWPARRMPCPGRGIRGIETAKGAPRTMVTSVGRSISKLCPSGFGTVPWRRHTALAADDAEPAPWTLSCVQIRTIYG